MTPEKKQDTRKPKNSRRGYSKKNADQVKIAKQHIERYFELAKDKYGQRPELADRYVTLARKVAMKFKIRFSRDQKRLFCPHCYRFAMPGDNSRVRVYKGRLSYFCRKCGKSWRMPLLPR
jgi:ribonuclease P protein subunit RPR2